MLVILCVLIYIEPTLSKSSDKPAPESADFREVERDGEEEDKEGEGEREGEGEGEGEREEEGEGEGEGEGAREGGEERVLTPLEPFDQPASLPSSLHPTPSVTNNLTSPFGEGFHSLPSLPGQLRDTHQCEF